MHYGLKWKSFCLYVKNLQVKKIRSEEVIGNIYESLISLNSRFFKLEIFELFRIFNILNSISLKA